MKGVSQIAILVVIGLIALGAYFGVQKYEISPSCSLLVTKTDAGIGQQSYSYTCGQFDTRTDKCTLWFECRNADEYINGNPSNSWEGNKGQVATASCEYGNYRQIKSMTISEYQCQAVCGDDVINPGEECEPSVKRYQCSANQPQECKNCKWVNIGSVCAYGCSNGLCNECFPNSANWCENNWVMKCVHDGARWVKQTDRYCNYQCSNGACIDPQCPICPVHSNPCKEYYCDSTTNYKCLERDKPNGPQAGCTGSPSNQPCKYQTCSAGECVVLNYPDGQRTNCEGYSNNCKENSCIAGVCSQINAPDGEYPDCKDSYLCVAGTCQLQPISITINSEKYYPLNSPFTTTAVITNIDSWWPVYAEIRDSSGIQVQQVQGSWQSGSAWVFSFDPLFTTGQYTIKVYLTHPADSTKQVSKTATFAVRQALVVTFGIDNYVQYTTKDIVTHLTVTPSSVQTSKVLQAKINGQPVSVNPIIKDSGGGTYDITIPAGQIDKVGSMDLIITVTDITQTYDPAVKKLEKIEYIVPKLNVELDVPLTARVGQSYDVKVKVYGIGSEPMDADRVELEITYVGGGVGEKYYSIKGDFIHTAGTGIYTLPYTFKYGQQHYFKASVWKSGYDSNYAQGNVAVGGGDVCACDTEKGTCQAGCSCDPDCEKPGFNWWILVVVILIVGAGFLIYKKVKK